MRLWVKQSKETRLLFIIHLFVGTLFNLLSSMFFCLLFIYCIKCNPKFQMQFEVVDSKFQNLNHLKDQNGSNKKAAWNNIPSCQDGIPAGIQAPVMHESSSKYSAKLQNAIASKEHILSETALRVLLSQRDNLVWFCLLLFKWCSSCMPLNNVKDSLTFSSMQLATFTL